MSSAYCTQADIEAHYGRDSVRKWADLNNREVADDIAARIALGIANASEEINDRMRGGMYTIPFSDSPDCPYRIKSICVLLAAYDIYNAKGTQDVDAEGVPVHRLSGDRTRALKTIDEILAGKIRIGSEEYNNAPSVVAIETGTEAANEAIDETDNWE
jgi:phage gp36-like protein